jgi:hypothetical protein
MLVKKSFVTDSCFSIKHRCVTPLYLFSNQEQCKTCSLKNWYFKLN